MADDDLTTIADVEAALLRSLTSDESPRVGRLIEQASGMLRDRRTNIDERIGAWSLNPRPNNAVAPMVVAAMLATVIKRVVTNPKGLWSTSETDGDYSISETYPGQRAGSDSGTPGDLELTAADLAKIDQRSGRRRSIRTSCLPYTAVPR